MTVRALIRRNVVRFEIRASNMAKHGLERLGPNRSYAVRIEGPGFNLAGLKIGEVLNIKIYFVIFLEFFQFKLIRPSFPECIFGFPGPK